MEEAVEEEGNIRAEERETGGRAPASAGEDSDTRGEE